MIKRCEKGIFIQLFSLAGKCILFSTYIQDILLEIKYKFTCGEQLHITHNEWPDISINMFSFMDFLTSAQITLDFSLILC